EVLELWDAPVAELRVELDKAANGGEHRVYQAFARPPVRVDGHAEHLGGLIVAVQTRMYERPEEVGEVRDSAARARDVPIDDRDRVRVPEDEVGLGEVQVAGHLGAGCELGGGGQVVHPAHETRAGRHGLTAEAEAVVRQ